MFYPIKLPKSTADAALFSGKMFAQCNCKRGGTGMAAVLSLAFVLFGGMIFFAVCGMLIERWCEEEQTASGTLCRLWLGIDRAAVPPLAGWAGES